MGRHATREDEVDRILRGGVFVDLYQVVRQGVRGSVESYSIKRIEKLYMPAREGPVTDAGFSVVAYETLARRRATRQHPRRDLAAYNRDDCVSTWMLRDWLEERRTRGAMRTRRPTGVGRRSGRACRARRRSRDAGGDGAAVDALTAGRPRRPGATDRRGAARAGCSPRCSIGIAARPSRSGGTASALQRARRSRSSRRVGDALGGLEFDADVEHGASSRLVTALPVHRRRSTSSGRRRADRPGGPARRPGRSVAHRRRGRADRSPSRRGQDSRLRHRGPDPGPPPIDTGSARGPRSRRRRGARAVASTATAPYRAVPRPAPPAPAAGRRRRRRRVRSSALARTSSLPPTAGSLWHSIRRSCRSRGRPGSGKTYTGARMIVELVRAGKKVGITAPAHKAITNLLDEAVAAAAEAASTLRAIQRVDDGEGASTGAGRHATRRSRRVAAALARGTVEVVAGTSWLFARPEHGRRHRRPVRRRGRAAVARQRRRRRQARLGRSSCSAIRTSCRRSARASIPTAPERRRSSTSSATHGRCPPDRGSSCRRPGACIRDVCGFISELFYEGRLEPMRHRQRQRSRSAAVDGTGIRFAPGRPRRRRVALGRARRRRSSRTRSAGCSAAVDGPARRDPRRSRSTTSSSSRRTTPTSPRSTRRSSVGSATGVRVGTVDKFQGQEAPVVDLLDGRVLGRTTRRATWSSSTRATGSTSRSLAPGASRSSSRARTCCASRCRTAEQMQLVNALLPARRGRRRADHRAGGP